MLAVLERLQLLAAVRPSLPGVQTPEANESKTPPPQLDLGL